MHTLLSVLLLITYFFYLSICTAEAKDIKIGLAAPLTGELATYGQEMLVAAKLAVHDINKSGGILGNNVELVVLDDSCNPSNAIGVANAMAKNQVVFVVGHFCSAASIAASNVYKEYSIVQMSPASTASLFTERGLNNVFRIIPSSNYEGKLIGEFFGRLDKKYSIAILSDGTNFAEDIANTAIKISKEKNANVILVDRYQPNQPDYQNIVLKIKQNNIKVLSLIGSRKVDQLTILRQIRTVGLDTLSIVNEPFDRSLFRKDNFLQAKGEILMSGLPNFTEEKGTDDIVKRLRREKIMATNFGLFTYAAVKIFSFTAEKSKSIEFDKIIEQIRSAKGFETILGEIRFDKQGDVQGIEYNFFKLTDGRFVAMNSRPPPPPPPPN
jgi:branched-chain amino acid transport system substrate-binding protein